MNTFSCKPFEGHGVFREIASFQVVSMSLKCINVTNIYFFTLISRRLVSSKDEETDLLMISSLFVRVKTMIDKSP